MKTREQIAFDVISYPLGSITETVILDVDPRVGFYPPAPTTRYLGHEALKIVDRSATENYNETPTYQAYSPETTTIISSTSDNKEAIDRGMGVVRVESNEGLREALSLFTNPNTDQPFYESPLYTNFSYNEIGETLFNPNEINIVGFVGRTGAGKSTFIRRLIEAIEDEGGQASLFEVDAFFKRSRQERKAWLAEPGISASEQADRRRVVTWWDLGRAAETLLQIHSGAHVQLEGLYDMRQGGEMVGKLDINPNKNGHVVFVEGTALLLPEFKDVIDSFIYMNVHDHIRAQSLMERNTRDGYTPEESRARKSLTDASETGEHIAETLRKDRFKSGRLTVLDNTARTDKLRLMPLYIPRH